MKILHVCTGWPLSFNGGITNYVRSLAFSQYNSGHEVFVLGAEDTETYPFNYLPYDSKIIPFTFKPLVDKESLNALSNLLQEKRFDIIHFHALEKIDWDIFTILQDTKYIISLHDYCFLCPRIYMFTPKNTVCEQYDEKKCKRCISYLERYKVIRSGIPRLNKMLSFNIPIPYIPQDITIQRHTKFVELLNNAAYILPVSTKVEEIFRNSGITTRSKVLHIGNISADTYKEDYSYDIESHTIKILFLGRLSVYKGADLFLRIAKEFINNPKIEFHFLGYAGSYERALKEAGVVNHGKYDQRQLLQILQGYDIGMVLSIWHDNGPQVVMELINNHVPVIGTKMGGIPDFVNYDNGYVFDPYDEMEIAETIEFINNLTPSQINEMKRNIKPTTTTREHYRDLMNIYNEVIGEKNGQ